MKNNTPNSNPNAIINEMMLILDLETIETPFPRDKFPFLRNGIDIMSGEHLITIPDKQEEERTLYEPSFHPASLRRASIHIFDMS
jgi:hypothetical protein